MASLYSTDWGRLSTRRPGSLATRGAQPAGQDLDDAVRDLGLLGHDLLEVFAGDLQEPTVAQRGDRGRPGGGVQNGHLPEALALAQLGDDPGLMVDLHL